MKNLQLLTVLSLFFVSLQAVNTAALQIQTDANYETNNLAESEQGNNPCNVICVLPLALDLNLCKCVCIEANAPECLLPYKLNKKTCECDCPKNNLFCPPNMNWD